MNAAQNGESDWLNLFGKCHEEGAAGRLNNDCWEAFANSGKSQHENVSVCSKGSVVGKERSALEISMKIT